jgi:Tol biopolymer transport system component
VTDSAVASRTCSVVAYLLLPLLLACAAVKPAPASTAAPQGASPAPAAPAIESGEPNGGRAATFSPDGTRIAFLSSTLHTPPDLWVMNADGSARRRLTIRGASSLRWAPDGNGVYISARRRGYDEILLVHLDEGGREERISWLPPNASFPSFSADGSLFAFTVLGANGVSDLWIATTDRTRIEPVTENINVRSFFWSPDGRKVFYEPGKTYGLGLWEIDLATMETRPLLSKYIGAPAYSAKAGRVAYPYPTNPGEFEVRTMNLDGSGLAVRKAPRLSKRWVAWAPDAGGVYYLGPDVQPPAAKEKKEQAAPAAEAKPVKSSEGATAKKKRAGGAKRTQRDRKGRRGAAAVHAERETGAAPPAKGPPNPGAPPKHGSGEAKPIAPHGMGAASESAEGAMSLWRLDLETGSERRVSPADLHVVDFSLSPDGSTAVVTGLLPTSHAPEIFRLGLATGDLVRLVASRASAWMPVPSPDATRVAYFTNEGFLESLNVADLQGSDTASYPGFSLEADTKVLWLPRSEGLVVFSGRGLHAFSESGPIAFPSSGDHKAYLYADASLQEDRLAISVIPKFGETPGLFVLEPVDGAFVQRDYRFPGPPEQPAEQYLQPRWSNDGTRLAFTDRVDVWTMNADGTGRRRLTRHWEANEKDKETQVLASFPAWSARGGRLAYTLTVYAGASVVRQLWVMEADGSSPRRVFSEEVDSQFQTFQNEFTSAPFFDPADARLIATALHRGVPNVVAIDVAEGKVTPLTETGAVFPAMLPEEDAIVYTSLEGNEERIWIMSSDGSEKRPFRKAPTSSGRSAGDGPPTAR